VWYIWFIICENTTIVVHAEYLKSGTCTGEIKLLFHDIFSMTPKFPTKLTLSISVLNTNTNHTGSLIFNNYFFQIIKECSHIAFQNFLFDKQFSLCFWTIYQNAPFEQIR